MAIPFVYIRRYPADGALRHRVGRLRDDDRIFAPVNMENAVAGFEIIKLLILFCARAVYFSFLNAAVLVSYKQIYRISFISCVY